MFSAGYTGINNLYKKLSILGGLCKIWFIPVEEVLSIPDIDPQTGYLSAAPTLIGDAVWRGPMPVPDKQLGITETQKNNTPGSYFEIKIEAQPPGDIGQQRVNLDNMVYGQYLVIGKLRAGGSYILYGSIDSPLDFDNQFTTGPGAATNATAKIAFTGQSITRGLVIPSFTGPDSGASFPSGPSAPVTMNQKETVFITNENTKAIGWTPLRQSKFGNFPTIEVWIEDPDNGNNVYLYEIQPLIDAPPPDFSVMTFNFPRNVTGFINIS